MPAADRFEDIYTVSEALGSGSFADVFSCHDQDGLTFAAKIVNKQKAGKAGVRATKSECTILSALSHPSIIHYVQNFESPHSITIVLELVMGGELFEKIVELRHYTERLAAKLTRNLVKTLVYLHSQNICHRDLKPENLMLRSAAARQTSSHQLRQSVDMDVEVMEHILTSVKLVDFGFAVSFVPGQRDLTECCGTPNFIAPEILNFGYFKTTREGYNEQCDMWSTGVLTYILLCGYPPFHAASRTQMFRYISKGTFYFHKDTVWDKISDVAKDFISKVMCVDLTKRLSALEASEHPFLQLLEASTPRKRTDFIDETITELKNFNARRKIKGCFFGVKAAHRVIYLAKCTEMSLKPNSALVKQLQAEEETDEDGDGNAAVDLTVLDLSQNYLGVKGLGAALAAIADSDTINTVKINNNQIDNAGVVVIVTALRTHPGVTSLDLSGNPITQLAGRHLLSLVQNNRKIVELNLTGTYVKDAVLFKINTQLKRNAKQNPNCSVM
eukprot:NODE_232_length_1960_cov_330.654631_g182_i0.p1 GENE.NODE_232_length_1960_cov_330.654631_g182_i0~~NODE_232_length_1960_cov_330.654631_g182_i0.p1  ORF type:complete len:501 (+),score=94.08 NODE_232_length_1960_cov_330.654631_g182_i0:106-1608(+)